MKLIFQSFYTALFLLFILPLYSSLNAAQIQLKDGSVIEGVFFFENDWLIKVHSLEGDDRTYYADEVALVDGVVFEGRLYNADVHPQVNHDLLQWMKDNRNERTGLPYSFGIHKEKKKNVYKKIGEAHSLTGIIERMIVDEGISVYDAALWQIVLTSLGGTDHLRLATEPTQVYWNGSLRELRNIRAGYDTQKFIYDLKKPAKVSSDLMKFGQRGFIFRILNAGGFYNSADPVDGKTRFENFPNWPTVHWEDWKPIAGENAWVTMAALQLFHKKYFDLDKQEYQFPREAVEIRLAKELARAAELLQASNGGIRMAPIGTYYHHAGVDELENPSVEEVTEALDNAEKYQEINAKEYEFFGGHKIAHHQIWYYDEISTENNISWYSALRMLHKITGKSKYSFMMRQIEKYFKTVWNAEEKYFYQGMHYYRDEKEWRVNTKFFAADVQNWIIAMLGPSVIDQWFGEGSAMEVWRTTKKRSGVFESDGSLLGVGFIEENQRLSVEWTMGAVYAAKRLAVYYKESHPEWVEEARQDAKNMRYAVDAHYTRVSSSSGAYSYSSKRGWIPFGWFSHHPEVLSLASTAWVMLHDLGFNPFELP